MEIDTLFDQNQQKVFRFAQSLLRNQAEAEEIVQEVFLKAMTNGDLLMNLPSNQIQAWLFKVTRNMIFDRSRAAKRRSSLTMLETVSIETNMNSLDLDYIIAKLPIHLKVIVDLKYREELSSVDILDLRNTSSTIPLSEFHFQNIGTVIFSKQTLHLFSKLSVENMGKMIECDPEMEMVTGKVTLSKPSLEKRKTPLLLFVKGKLSILDAITESEIQDSVGKIIVQGKLICTEETAFILDERKLELSGKMETFPDRHCLLEGDIHVDSNYLKSLPNQSNLAVFGNCYIDPETSQNLLKQKIQSLFIRGKLKYHESFTDLIENIIHKNSLENHEVYENNCRVITSPVRFENSDVALWKEANLHFSDRVEFGTSVEPKILEAKLKKLKCEGMIFCRENLKPILAQKCDLFSSTVYSYLDVLLINDGNRTLEAGSLKGLQGKLTIANFGEMEFNMYKEEFLESIYVIYNFGTIRAPCGGVGIQSVT